MSDNLSSPMMRKASSNTTPCEVQGFDEHGFAIFARDGPTPESERCHTYRSFKFTERHVQSWTRVLSDWQAKSTCKMESYLVKGVPAWLRPRLWVKLLDINALKDSARFDYKTNLNLVRDQLVDLGISEYGGEDAVNFLCDIERHPHKVKYGQVSMEALRHIMLDLDRSYPTHTNYMGNSVEAQEGRASLFRVLATYARYNRTVEYCQGMSSIAGMFLMYLREEEAFWCFVSLLERHKYMLGYFDDAMERVQKHAKVLQRLLIQRQPRLNQHLEEMGISVLMYVTPWFMCLFTSLPCWDTVLSIWDLLLLEGHKCIFRVALAILDVLSCDLLQTSSMCQALPLLLHPPSEKMSYDSLMPVIWSTHIEDWEVSSLLAVIAEEHPQSPVVGKKRTRLQAQRGSSVVEFQGRDAPRTKRQRMNTDENEAPSLFGKIMRIFRPNNGETTAPKPTIQPKETPPPPVPRPTRLTPRKRLPLTPRTARRRPHLLSTSAVPDPGIRVNASALSKGSRARAASLTQLEKNSRPVTHTTSKPGNFGTRKGELVLSPPLDVSSFRLPVLTLPSVSGVAKPVFPQLHQATRMSPRIHRPGVRPSCNPTALHDFNTPPASLHSSLITASSHHTFKSFHTPIPLRRNQTVTPDRSVWFSSPEVELKTFKRHKQR